MASRPEGYRSRIDPRAGAPMPEVSAAAYGAEAANAVIQLGETIQSEKLQNYRIERKLDQNRQWTGFQTGYAAVREEMATAAREGRQSDAPGHADRMAELYRERQTALLEGIGDDEVRRRAKGSLEDWGAQFRTGEADWETLRAGEVAAEQFEQSRDASANRVRRLESPQDYGLELEIQLDAIDGLAASDKVKEQLREETEQVLAIGFLQGRIDSDPQVAKVMLESGAFDEVLQPNQVEALLNGSAVEMRRIDAAQQQAIAQEKSEFRETLRDFNVREGQGRDVTAEIPALLERARAYGMDDVVSQLEGSATTAEFGRVYEGASPIQLEQRLAELGAKDSLTDQEAMERQWIEDKLPSISTRFNDDPVGFYAREGGAGAPPPLDFEDPASIAARSRWAAGAAGASGRPVPVLSKGEADQLRSTYEDGRQGEAQVMALLDRLPVAQRMAAAKMIDPGDRTLPIVATLNPASRAQARRGREALRANGKLLSEIIKADMDLEEDVLEVNRQFERALVAVPPDQRNAIFETAKQLAAGQVDKFGGGMDGRLWRLVLSQAVGAQNVNGERRGGFAIWGDRWFLVPEGRTANEFRDIVLRTAARGEVKPVNPDGSPARLGRAFPVAVGGGLYEYRTASGAVVMGNNGKPWRVKVPGQ
jgi:hypothetical protein